jgi:hypothetical protein
LQSSAQRLQNALESEQPSAVNTESTKTEEPSEPSQYETDLEYRTVNEVLAVRLGGEYSE